MSNLEHKPLSHQDMGWQNFTNEALRWINEKDGPVVFLLWGAKAIQAKKLLTNPKHLKELNVDSNYTFIVAHVDALEAAKEYAQKIESQIEGAKVKIIDLVSAVGIHTGLGCLALQVFNEMKD